MDNFIRPSTGSRPNPPLDTHPPRALHGVVAACRKKDPFSGLDFGGIVKSAPELKNMAPANTGERTQKLVYAKSLKLKTLTPTLAPKNGTKNARSNAVFSNSGICLPLLWLPGPDDLFPCWRPHWPGDRLPNGPRAQRKQNDNSADGVGGRPHRGAAEIELHFALPGRNGKLHQSTAFGGTSGASAAVHGACQPGKEKTRNSSVLSLRHESVPTKAQGSDEQLALRPPGYNPHRFRMVYAGS